MKTMLTFLLLGASAIAAEKDYSKIDIDLDAQSIGFYAHGTDLSENTTVEFLFIGPGSDKDYEALYVTDAQISDIARAVEKLGVPSGKCYDQVKCILWPVGSCFDIEPQLTNIVKETYGERIPQIIYTGGKKNVKGELEAEKESPFSVLAFYNCPQSLFQLNDSLGQSENYGRFRTLRKISKEEHIYFKLTLNKSLEPKSHKLKLTLSNFTNEFAKLVSEAKKCRQLDVLCEFDEGMTLFDAGKISQAISSLDSPAIKMNGFIPGQFFYGAYLPLEKWRDRKERLSQPPEVHFLDGGKIKVVEIIEDWSDDESIDPKLSEKVYEFTDVVEAAKKASELGSKKYSILLFAKPAEKLSRLYEFRKHTTGPLNNWYIFTE